MLPVSMSGCAGMMEALTMGLDSFPMGFCVIDPDRRVLFANRAARLFFEKGEVISAPGGVLRLVSRTHEGLISSLLTRAVEGDAQPAAFRFVRPRQKPVSFLLLPYAGRAVPAPGQRQPGALLVIGDPQWPHEYDTTLVGSLFGFTPAESGIAALLMRGQAVEEISIAQGVTKNTIRNQLKRMFTKTYTRTQAGLTRTLLESPAHLAVRPDIAVSIPASRPRRTIYPSRKNAGVQLPLGRSPDSQKIGERGTL